MIEQKHIENLEKKRIALISLLAAVFLTAFKLSIGLWTHSLGILSEAAHSGLDLIAAGMTLFAVRMSSKPADEEHHFGHGKVENISALFETFLLLITCVWIIYEVIERLQGKHSIILVNAWSFIVIGSSIIIDFSRSRALKKISVKYNSQALEADAIHFSSDIYSSAVVFIGLIGVYFNFKIADSFAALVVAILVIIISIRLGKRSVDVLLDRAPKGIKEKVAGIISEIPGILRAHDIRVRNTGPDTLIELNIHVNPTLSVEQAHEISDKVEDIIGTKIGRCVVHVHIEPETSH
jgi:cation diffusion facilitator family transporter